VRRQPSHARRTGQFGNFAVGNICQDERLGYVSAEWSIGSPVTLTILGMMPGGRIALVHQLRWAKAVGSPARTRSSVSPADQALFGGRVTL